MTIAALSAALPALLFLVLVIPIDLRPTPSEDNRTVAPEAYIVETRSSQMPSFWRDSAMAATTTQGCDKHDPLSDGQANPVD